MRLAILTLVAVSTLLGADELRLALVLKAQADFDRVELDAAPQPRDTAACIQSQAAVLPVATVDERALILFRKGYCALAQAAISSDSAQFGDAAVAFDQAGEAWRAQIAAAKPKVAPGPIPSPLRVFGAVARLEQNPDAASLDTQAGVLVSAVDTPTCEPTLISPDSCLAANRLGNAWLGWLALQHGDLNGAISRFTGAQVPSWLQWVQGQEAFRAGNYQQAASDYRQALDSLRKIQQNPAAPVLQRLSPKPDTAARLADLGEAQLLSHDAAAAIETLDAAVKADPAKPRTIYLRARAKEAAEQTAAALVDYDLASRTAFAAAPGKSSGEAHFYRGILLYRRADWPRAEDEFADALNFDIPAAMRSDASAWRNLAAVVSGSCGASRGSLERSLTAVSPDFPKEDARLALAACVTAGSASEDVGWHRLK
jgi:tetratricopeptide (TPR) repeat protein